MGRQVRKIAPWMGMVESHLHSNHVIHRLYRWTSYHSHPTLRPGHPFKTRAFGRPYPGVLLTPDSFIFRIPLALAFVSVDKRYNPRFQGASTSSRASQSKKNELMSAGNFKQDSNCQKSVINYNKCIRNNSQSASDSCFYYLNYLNSNCSLNN
jgi:hypothetical protein